MKTILVTGGAGYIGSHAVRRLLEKGYKVVVIDNISRGNEKSLPENIPFYQIDISDKKQLTEILNKHKIDAVMHFAAFAYVGESVNEPSMYYENNMIQSKIFFDTLIQYNVNKVIFSSTCATYGVPDTIPITEEEKQQPINPYGWTKLMIEQVLKDYDTAYGMKSIFLRYFNAAGAAYGIGEDHDPETHLIPIVLQVALGQREKIKIFGTDFETRDGTCIRDYIHVIDLADAHILALEYLFKENKSNYFNLGTGLGTSVKEIIEVSREITQHPIPVEETPRRAGDPPSLIANSHKAKTVLGWEPKLSVKDIINSAWKWHFSNPEGF
jgi:UDP-glucose 4-epimerase